MYQPLAPCTQCRRHVRATDARCPFCAALREPTEARTPSYAARLSRAGLLAIAASISVAACHEDTTTPKVAPDPASPKVAPAPKSDPPADPSADAGLVDDPGAPVAEYGAPAPPTVTPSAKPPPLAVPAYGAPAPIASPKK